MLYPHQEPLEVRGKARYSVSLGQGIGGRRFQYQLKASGFSIWVQTGFSIENCVLFCFILVSISLDSSW